MSRGGYQIVVLRWMQTKVNNLSSIAFRYSLELYQLRMITDSCFNIRI